jgi:hypothetical protein
MLVLVPDKERRVALGGAELAKPLGLAVEEALGVSGARDVASDQVRGQGRCRETRAQRAAPRTDSFRLSGERGLVLNSVPPAVHSESDRTHRVPPGSFSAMTVLPGRARRSSTR